MVLQLVVDEKLADELTAAYAYVRAHVPATALGITVADRPVEDIKAVLGQGTTATAVTSGSLSMIQLEASAVNTLGTARIRHVLTSSETLAELKTSLGQISINADVSDISKNVRRLDKDAEVQALCLLIYWMRDRTVASAAADLVFVYVHGGRASHHTTSSMKLIDAEEGSREVIGLSGWRRCIMFNDLLVGIDGEGRFSDVKHDGERLLKAMTADGVQREGLNNDTVKRYLALGKRLMKHAGLLMKWEAFCKRSMLIDKIFHVRAVFRPPIGKRTWRSYCRICS